MAADVEVVALVLGGAGDAADVVGVGFQDGDGHLFLGEQIARGQAGGAGADDGDGIGMDHSKTPLLGSWPGSVRRPRSARFSLADFRGLGTDPPRTFRQDLTNDPRAGEWPFGCTDHHDAMGSRVVKAIQRNCVDFNPLEWQGGPLCTDIDRFVDEAEVRRFPGPRRPWAMASA